MPKPLTETHSDLAYTWWSDKNTIRPEDVSYGSHQEVLWQCPEYDNHVFPTKVAYMSRRTGCRLCTKQLVISGINDAMTTHGEIISRFFDYGKNTIDPTKVSSGTAKQAWWICPECSYSWQTSFMSVTRGSGCARCAGVVHSPGVNTVDVLFPDLIDNYWDLTRNDKRPDEVTAGADYRVGLKCPDCPAEWATSAYNFFTLGSRCPGCINKLVVPGVNDLATTHPDVVEGYWSPRNTIKPTEITSGSNTRVYWTCKQSHERLVPVHAVAQTENRCPQCAHPESKAQHQVREYIMQVYSGKVLTSPTRDVIPPREIDIYLPDLLLAVEVNGVFHHSTYYTAHADSRRDQEKSAELFNKGISFIGIWTDDWVHNTERCKQRIHETLEVLQNNRQPMQINTGYVMDLDRHYGSMVSSRWGIKELVPPGYRHLSGNKRLPDGEGDVTLPKVYAYGKASLVRRTNHD